MIKLWKRSISLYLVAGILLGILNLPATANTPAVTVDETAYVTMDYYGNVSGSSIVKGCDLNGNTEIIDYGDYASVINMTTLDKPQTDGDKTVFYLTEAVPYNRFYYQVKPREETMSFPWTFDVNYKLNGVPVKREDNYSFTAPGAQFQSLASYQIAAYSPSTIRITSMRFSPPEKSVESL